VSALTIAAVAGNALMFAIAAALMIPFFARPGALPKTPHEAPPSLWLGPVVLAVTALAGGPFLARAVALFVQPMTAAVTGEAVTLELYLIPPGLKPPVILTLITVGLGLAAFAVFGRLRAGIAAALETVGWGPDRGFDQVMRGLVRGAFALTRVIQPGAMKSYVTVTFIAVAAALFLPLLVDGLPGAAVVGAVSEPFHFVVLAIAVAGLWIVITAKSRLVAIVSLGVQGLMVALIFMLYGAPDLSFTQFMVETLSVVILALVMTRLDLQASDHRPRWTAARDGTIALTCGLGFAVLLYGVVQQPFDDRLSEFFLAHAYDIAHGRNVVNVILVDYRALDTLGEIAVVMGAGLAILVLMRMGPSLLQATGAAAGARAPADGEGASSSSLSERGA
jgi:multicomponent Na+:H+ antiporter subunit A